MWRISATIFGVMVGVLFGIVLGGEALVIRGLIEWIWPWSGKILFWILYIPCAIQTTICLLAAVVGLIPVGKKD